ncbi:MAG: hypothetical protein M3Q72_12470, partial [Actinomycetota bacterium]|nr:hypothetical protein [Actinomycetota bacterium]
MGTSMETNSMLGRNVFFGIALTLTLAVGCGEPLPVAFDGGQVDAARVDASIECPTGTDRCGALCVDTDESRAH